MTFEGQQLQGAAKIMEKLQVNNPIHTNKFYVNKFRTNDFYFRA